MEYNDNECVDKVITESGVTCYSDWDGHTLICVQPIGAACPCGLMAEEIFARQKPEKNVAELPHYMGQKVQPIEYMKISMTSEEFKGYLKGNVLKYVSRAESKNGIEDYEKAQVYLNWLLEFVKTGKITVAGELK